MLNENDNLKEEVTSLKTSLASTQETLKEASSSAGAAPNKPCESKQFKIIQEENERLLSELEDLKLERNEAEKKVLLSRQLGLYFKFKE